MMEWSLGPLPLPEYSLLFLPFRKTRTRLLFVSSLVLVLIQSVHVYKYFAILVKNKIEKRKKKGGGNTLKTVLYRKRLALKIYTMVFGIHYKIFREMPVV